MSRSVRMWGYEQKSKYGVRSAVFCTDKKILEHERERSVKEGFTVGDIRLTYCRGEQGNKELWAEVY